MNIGTYSYEEYLHLVESFHGSLAPGLIIGGFMVDLALKHLPDGEFFDAVCETPACLPDAVQILTPCTIGNGWLKVLNLGRFAVTLYEKYGGAGVRVYIDTKKLEAWPEVQNWYLKLEKKPGQNADRLMAQIKEAGPGLLSIQQVCIEPEKIKRKNKGPIGICPECGEAFPLKDGENCLNCQGETPYKEVTAIASSSS